MNRTKKRLGPGRTTCDWYQAVIVFCVLWGLSLAETEHFTDEDAGVALESNSAIGDCQQMVHANPIE